ncbi:MAG: T9SS type A sorting domain-containing protein, partial [Fibrobacteres bacterium]|nr:T9SS type A sorting domain-containing protein [Fibrobacterota bacterium]
IYCARKNPVHSEFTFQKDILKNPINISPNPATNLVQIRTNGISGNIQITFTGIDGKTALKMNTKTIKTINTFKTNVNSLPTGAYIIRASDGRSIYTKLITLIK